MVEREEKYEREIEREYWKPKSLQSFSKTWKICHVNHGCQFISYPLPLAMNNFPIWNAWSRCINLKGAGSFHSDAVCLVGHH